MAKQIPIMIPMIAKEAAVTKFALSLTGANIEKKIDIDGKKILQISIVAKRIVTQK